MANFSMYISYPFVLLSSVENTLLFPLTDLVSILKIKGSCKCGLYPPLSTCPSFGRCHSVGVTVALKCLKSQVERVIGFVLDVGHDCRGLGAAQTTVLSAEIQWSWTESVPVLTELN